MVVGKEAKQTKGINIMNRLIRKVKIALGLKPKGKPLFKIITVHGSKEIVLYNQHSHY